MKRNRILIPDQSISIRLSDAMSGHNWFYHLNYCARCIYK